MVKTRARIKRERRAVDLSKLDHVTKITENAHGVLFKDMVLDQLDHDKEAARVDVLHYLRDPRLPEHQRVHADWNGYVRHNQYRYDVEQDAQGVPPREDVPTAQYNVVWDPVHDYAHKLENLYKQEKLHELKTVHRHLHHYKADRDASQHQINDHVTRLVQTIVPTGGIESL